MENETGRGEEYWTKKWMEIPSPEGWGWVELETSTDRSYSRTGSFFIDIFLI